jgi:UV DNA damage endonuclease
MRDLTRIRWGLCCQFLDAPIRFRQATHRYVATLAPVDRRAYLSAIARANAIALAHAVERCHELGIGAFRINSQMIPLATHPTSGYALEDLDQGDVIIRSFQAAGEVARERDIRLSFHPDQFVVLNSERDEVVRSSVQELDFQASMAELVGADTLCLHGGGLTGGMPAALDRLARGLDQVSDRARSRVAFENDDRLFAPADLLPFCERAGVPFIYDSHHHRCRPDGLSAAEATAGCVASWGTREAYMHLSSPRDGWSDAVNSRPHADYAALADVPEAWNGLAATVDVEAKDKERAVLDIMAQARAAAAA